MDGADTDSRPEDHGSGPGSGADERGSVDSERVQEAFQQWGQRVSRLLTVAAARVREEAEDIVAEAQSIRRGERE